MTTKCLSSFFRQETLAQVFSCEFYEILRTPFLYRTPPVTVSDFFRGLVVGSSKDKVFVVFYFLKIWCCSVRGTPEMSAYTHYS